jgi:hypothetical protein
MLANIKLSRANSNANTKALPLIKKSNNNSNVKLTKKLNPTISKVTNTNNKPNESMISGVNVNNNGDNNLDSSII